nr:reverse transcriptase domain-containing protein [Tanacetum cinerariifolium]
MGPFQRSHSGMPTSRFYRIASTRYLLQWFKPIDQDSLNSAACGNLLKRSAHVVLKIIKNKSKVRNSRNKLIVSQVKESNVDSSEIASVVASAVTSAMTAMFKQHQVTPAPASVKAVEESCVTCGGAHSYQQCPATDGKTFLGICWLVISKRMPLPLRVRDHFSAIPLLTRDEVVFLMMDHIFLLLSSLSKVVERVPEVTKDTVQPSTKNIQPLVVQTQVPIDEPVVAPKPKPTIPCSLRANKQKLREKDDNLALKFVEIYRNLHFNLSFAYALLHIINNKEKLFELATTLVNENCSAVILKKLPKKLGDLGNFLIPCDFPELLECLALADLGASINLMPLSIWKKLSLPELTPTRMILKLADRSTTRPAGITEDVFVKVGKFHFPTDFVVVDYVVDSRVPLILGRPFLRTERALIDVYACEEYVQEVLGFFDKSKSGNPTPISDPIIALSSPSLTPFEEVDFNLEEIKACLIRKSIPPGIDDTDFDLEGDIRLLEKLLNDDPSSSPLPPKELNVEEIKTVKSSIDEPPELELKELPSHFEYAFLEGTEKLPVIVSKELKDEEKSSPLKVLKSHKWAIAWKIFDIKGIDPHFCTHIILMEDDFKPAVQHQRRVNPKIHKVIKKEVIKLLDARLMYPIFDSPWVSLVHCVPKKGGMTVIENKDNELIPTRLVTGLRVCIENGNNMKSLGRDSKGGIIILPPVSFEEHVVVQRETKARTLLLQSLPEDHMADFHHLDDAREI